MVVRSVHGVVEVLEGRLSEVCRTEPPLVVEANGGAPDDVEPEDGIAVTRATWVLTCTELESLVQTAFDVPIATDVLQDFPLRGAGSILQT